MTSRPWTNERAIAEWSEIPKEVLAAMEPYGDFAKEHLLNDVMLRMLGDVSGKRVLDAGCGHGYFSRLLAARGAQVVGVEPATSLFDYAVEAEARERQGIRYVKEDLSTLSDLGHFDAVVASMVFIAIPEWRDAPMSPPHPGLPLGVRVSMRAAAVLPRPLRSASCSCSEGRRARAWSTTCAA